MWTLTRNTLLHIGQEKAALLPSQSSSRAWSTGSICRTAIMLSYACSYVYYHPRMRCERPLWSSGQAGDQMNWRRGFTRIWIILTFIWFVIIAVVARNDYRWSEQAQVLDTTAEGCNDTKKGIPLTCLRMVDVTIHRDVPTYIGLALGPPIALIFVGVLIGWVAGGFRRNTN